VLIFLVFLSQTARLSSFVGAMAIGDLIKSTLGPKGMDKILWGTGRNEGVVEVSEMKIYKKIFVYFLGGPQL
jgi:T-complex protein 1 subunit beta